MSGLFVDLEYWFKGQGFVVICVLFQYTFVVREVCMIVWIFEFDDWCVVFVGYFGQFGV